MQVVIVGASLEGLALSRHLTRAKIHHVVLESSKRSLPLDLAKSATPTFSAPRAVIPTYERFRSITMGDSIKALLSNVFYDPEERKQLPYDEMPVGYDTGLNMSKSSLDPLMEILPRDYGKENFFINRMILKQRLLDGVQDKVFWGKKVIGFKENPQPRGGVVTINVEIESAKDVNANLVVFCDGEDSIHKKEIAGEIKRAPVGMVKVSGVINILDPIAQEFDSILNRIHSFHTEKSKIVLYREYIGETDEHYIRWEYFDRSLWVQIQTDSTSTQREVVRRMKRYHPVLQELVRRTPPENISLPGQVYHTKKMPVWETKGFVTFLDNSVTDSLVLTEDWKVYNSLFGAYTIASGLKKRKEIGEIPKVVNDYEDVLRDRSDRMSKISNNLFQDEISKLQMAAPEKISAQKISRNRPQQQQEEQQEEQEPEQQQEPTPAQAEAGSGSSLFKKVVQKKPRRITSKSNKNVH
eukprot:TRINITY_DN5026_c0_g1_i1.p1 TRINITY_DN5026_c0_g1~~TRINITY_DN5026_c0_g1_i1.p1  ORF type:complete len:468 (-),score=162.80 TRINITY_DN5026_c0_g1_i1:59-1462(-)